MTVDNTQFPPNLEQGFRGGPRFNTSVWSNPSGTEFRNINAPRSPGKWTFDQGWRDTELSGNDFDLLVNMFWAAQGKAYGFLFKDWLDFQAYDMPLFPVEGAEGTFQLYKVYTNGIRNFNRKITRPVSGSVIIMNSGVEITPTSINYQNGRVVPGVGDETTLTATFEFLVPVRFDTDEADFEAMLADLKNARSLSVVEIIE